MLMAQRKEVLDILETLSLLLEGDLITRVGIQARVTHAYNVANKTSKEYRHYNGS